VGLDPPPQRGTDKNLVLSPDRRVDNYFQKLVPGRASGQWKNRTAITLYADVILKPDICSFYQHCLSAVKRVLYSMDCVIMMMMKW